jgi:hypothetical protein
MERAPELEPPTFCLEGRYLHIHRSHAVSPLKTGTSRVSRLYVINGAAAKVKHNPATHILRPYSAVLRNIWNRAQILAVSRLVASEGGELEAESTGTMLQVTGRPIRSGPWPDLQRCTGHLHRHTLRARLVLLRGLPVLPAPASRAGPGRRDYPPTTIQEQH